MAFTDFFIRRPVWAIVVSSLILLLGLQAGAGLQVRQFPELERGVLFVTTNYPGASASTVQGFVTTPLQNRIATAGGVDYITSESLPGQSLIQVHLRLGENTNDVLAEVIARINEARYLLPDEVEDPVVRTETPGEALMYLSFQSNQLSDAQVADYLLRAIQPALATVPGNLSQIQDAIARREREK